MVTVTFGPLREVEDVTEILETIKKVLRERKRNTTCRVASTRYDALSPREDTPIQSPMGGGGVPHPVPGQGGTQS